MSWERCARVSSSSACVFQLPGDAPTATIANIVGVSASIEPTYQNLYVKSKPVASSRSISEYLVRDLKKLNTWDEVMIADLKYLTAAGQDRPRSQEVRNLYAPASKWTRHGSSRRARAAEVDRPGAIAQYLYAGASGKKLDDIYKLAWNGAQDHLLPAHAGATSRKSTPVAASERRTTDGGVMGAGSPARRRTRKQKFVP